MSKYGVFSGPYLDPFHAVEWTLFYPPVQLTSSDPSVQSSSPLHRKDPFIHLLLQHSNNEPLHPITKKMNLHVLNTKFFYKIFNTGLKIFIS